MISFWSTGNTCGVRQKFCADSRSGTPRSGIGTVSPSYGGNAQGQYEQYFSFSRMRESGTWITSVLRRHEGQLCW